MGWQVEVGDALCVLCAECRGHVPLRRCHYHPDATDHYRISEQLQQFIQAVVPGWQAGKKQGAT